MYHFDISGYCENHIANGALLDSPISDKLAQKIITHRNEFIRIFISKYAEFLPLNISYENIQDTDFMSVDFTALEIALRLEDRYPVICRSKKGNFLFCGFVNKDYQGISNYGVTYKPLTDKDIHFILDRNLFDNKLTEITDLDNFQTGDFVVFKNKVISGISDLELVLHYATELGELIASRLSLIIQSKVHTLVLGDENDESVNQLIQSFYNGSPFIKSSTFFDIDERLIKIDNSNIVSSLTEIKRQYQNSVNELNTLLGINTLGVDKESGVSKEEVESNISYVYPIANTYLTARQNALNKLNIRYGVKLYATYNKSISASGGNG